jgi:hypothetical protein
MDISVSRFPAREWRSPPTLGDIILDVGYAAALLGIAILFVGMYRAFEVGRVLMRGVYRSRAYWTAATAFALVLFTLAADFLPSSNPLSFLSFFFIAIVLLVFVDSSIEVARDTDFFHRSVLGWERLRRLFGVLLLASSIVALLDFYTLGIASIGTSLLAILGVGQFFAVLALIFSWGAAALTIGARRSADRSLRRFARMLGLVVVCFVLFLTVWIPFAPFSATIQDVGSTISIFAATAGAYFLYLAVASLSPLGRVEKETLGSGDPTGKTEAPGNHART